VATNPLRAVRLPAERAQTLESLRRTAWALDNMFEVPGVGFRFGLDAIAGLVPGLGDLTTPIFGVWLLLQAFRMRVPKVVLARMALNVGLDALVGLIPIVGDLFDMGFKANMRNMALLDRHADPFAQPTRGDYVFVGVVLAIVASCALLPIAALFLLLYYVGILGNVPLI
jgi:Domain of unknown function (DUF4112)